MRPSINIACQPCPFMWSSAGGLADETGRVLMDEAVRPIIPDDHRILDESLNLITDENSQIIDAG